MACVAGHRSTNNMQERYRVANHKKDGASPRHVLPLHVHFVLDSARNDLISPRSGEDSHSKPVDAQLQKVIGTDRAYILDRHEHDVVFSGNSWNQPDRSRMQMSIDTQGG